MLSDKLKQLIEDAAGCEQKRLLKRFAMVAEDPELLEQQRERRNALQKAALAVYTWVVSSGDALDLRNAMRVRELPSVALGQQLILMTSGCGLCINRRSGHGAAGMGGTRVFYDCTRSSKTTVDALVQYAPDAVVDVASWIADGSLLKRIEDTLAMSLDLGDV